MISLIVPVVFFCLLVLIFPLASMVLSITARILKQREGKHDINGKTSGDRIDKRTEKLKDAVFKVLVFLIFFFVSPFVVFYLIL